ncbi:amylo-alpha-1,6-glucosidase [Anaeromyxobacter sp. Red801]|uniref:amylo-alpha-1,6-glucosidase n=1 Tax=Anaeromyxobacter sp. Red801 TaxID=3411632 RepID=UPI003BA06CA8
MIALPVRQGWAPADGAEALLEREWLVANGLGGYASGTLAGACTRRYHGLLVAALPGVGRAVMLSHLSDRVRLADGRAIRLAADERSVGLALHGAEHLRGFRLEGGLPVWTYRLDGAVLERRVALVHGQNTVHVSYRLLDGDGPVRLTLRPGVHFRPHDAPVSGPVTAYRLVAAQGRFEVAGDDPRFPPLRLLLHGARAAFTVEEERLAEVVYRVEASRGYDTQGDLFSPGFFRVDLGRDAPVTLVASTEPWDRVAALAPEEALRAERARREALLARAPEAARRGPAAELVLAADAFVVEPAGRVQQEAQARAEGDAPRTVIAGYHWFTDWGRDTMISLEGLTLCTGRARDAAAILRAFARHVRDGLIPNLFPEGDAEGLYHTADATLWLFHAVDRYVRTTGDRQLLRRLLPVLRDVVAHHQRGTRFGIGVDPEDGLLRQGEQGYQLTWMDAKVEGWVVTPRRGKAVEINALWFNALANLARWLEEEGEGEAARAAAQAAARARASFNRRFWNAAGRQLFDVVDGEDGRDDPACRPNQLLAVSLPSPVLERDRWAPVLETVRDRLLTPVGLRSLSRDHPDYKATYHGDLRTRDAAYHQGTVWSWLVGPWVDAWLRVHPGDLDGARRALDGLVGELGHACLGQISEVFDAEPPFTPRGCVAQAWGVAELLRALLRVSGAAAAQAPGSRSGSGREIG